MHVDRELLTLLALGESVDDETGAHLGRCASCRDELDSLRTVVGLGREAPPEAETEQPPERVWEAIAAEIHAGTPETPDATAPAEQPRPRRAARTGWAGRRRGLVLAAGSAAAGLVVGAVAALGIYARAQEPPAPQLVASTAIRPVGEAASRAGGSAELVRHDNRLSLRIDAHDLPPVKGYYEVWAFVPGTTTMQPMGTLEPGQVTTLAVPSGMDVGRFAGIDVSAEPYDGNPAHSGKSVLRGRLTR
nr:anti-sigma factor [Actinopolymorpha cephalotaxi]